MSVRMSFYDVGLQGSLKETKNLSEQCGGLLGNVLINVSKKKKIYYCTLLFGNEDGFFFKFLIKP